MIRSLVIPTDGRRPTLLRRCIATHARQSELDGLPFSLTVVDNSGSVECEEETRRVLREFAYGLELRFIGSAERRRYIGHLVDELGGEASGARAELAYALGPGSLDLEAQPAGNVWPRLGSDAPARNALQLDQVGHRYVSVDDDTTAFFSRVPGSKVGAEWIEAAYEDPTEFWFYGDAQEAFDDAPRFVLRPLYDALFCNALDGREVLAAMTGLVGDSAMSPSAFLLTRHGITRAHLLADYELARRARHVRRGALAPTLAAHPFFMTVCSAFDGRALLPPFLPLDRDSDGLWGHVLRATTGSLIAHVPFCVTHDPGEDRPAMLSDLSTRPTPAKLVRLVIDAWPRPTTQDVATRMRSLGHFLLDWSELDPPEFERRLCGLRWVQLESSAERLEADGILADSADEPSPAAWRNDVQFAARAKRLLVGNPLAIHPPGAHARSYLAALARLLDLWPDVDAAARRLSSRGVRIALDEPPF